MRAGAVLRAATAIAVLSLMDAVIKAMAASYPIFQVAFLRFGFGLVVATAALALARPGLASRETFLANAARAVLTVFTATTFFFALGELPLAEALVLTFLSPMFVAFFGVLMLGERPDRRIVAALVAGFAGVLVVVSDQLETGDRARSLAGVAAALVSAVCYAFGLVLLRARAQRDPIVYIVFLQNLGAALILSPGAYWVWQPPTWPDIGLFALIGALGVGGHFLLTSAFARAEAARLASLEYTALIWAALLGYAFFQEVPTLATAAGAVLIVTGAFVASRR
ncbi:MAG TPA: DMT family transporter [Beijerinckiaceae bacterium]|nr:DMT family transporter [Beijerinckiaceae bacterium]